MTEVYFDYNASGPLDPRAADVMVPCLRSGVGNASSSHHFGLRQAALVEKARGQVAELIDAPASGVVFCSGAAEANNLALWGLAMGAPAERNRLVVSAVEHASVLGRQSGDGDYSHPVRSFVSVTGGCDHHKFFWSSDLADINPIT